MSEDMLYASAPATDAKVTQRTLEWLEKAVIGLNLCPFARAPVRQGLLRCAVTAAIDADQLLAELAQQATDLVRLAPLQLETVLLVHPDCMEDFFDFNFFLEEANALLKRMALRGVLQIASFHPHYQFAHTDANDVGNFTNRSPYPMLHLLREASVARAAQTLPDASVITQRNIDTLQRLGVSGWHGLWS